MNPTVFESARDALTEEIRIFGPDAEEHFDRLDLNSVDRRVLRNKVRIMITQLEGLLGQLERYESALDDEIDRGRSETQRRVIETSRLALRLGNQSLTKESLRVIHDLPDVLA